MLSAWIDVFCLHQVDALLYLLQYRASLSSLSLARSLRAREEVLRRGCFALR